MKVSILNCCKFSSPNKKVLVFYTWWISLSQSHFLKMLKIHQILNVLRYLLLDRLWRSGYVLHGCRA